MSWLNELVTVKENIKMEFIALALGQSKSVSFRISLQWPIHAINSDNKNKLFHHFADKVVCDVQDGKLQSDEPFDQAHKFFISG